MMPGVEDHGAQVVIDAAGRVPSRDCQPELAAEGVDRPDVAGRVCDQRIHATSRRMRFQDGRRVVRGIDRDRQQPYFREPSLEPQSDREEILSAPHSLHAGDTDAAGTGERGSAVPDEQVRDGDDISPDRIGRLGDLAADDDDLADLAADDETFEEDLSEDDGR